MASISKYLSLLLLFLLAGPMLTALSGKVQMGADWRTATRGSAGIAPDPAVFREPLVQVYGARAFSWRGAFAVHTWIATKRRDAEDYRVYEVIGWRAMHGQSALSQRADRHPDRQWYGAQPTVYLERQGAEAEELIDQIEVAVASYPYKDTYRTWPGPNSNTFTAHVARMTPSLRLDLPPTAIGKDFLGDTTFAAAAPSGTGYQVSLFGALGLLVGLEEGLELNLLGLTVGIDPMDLSIKLPGLGRLGPGGA